MPYGEDDIATSSGILCIYLAFQWLAAYILIVLFQDGKGIKASCHDNARDDKEGALIANIIMQRS